MASKAIRLKLLALDIDRDAEDQTRYLAAWTQRSQHAGPAHRACEVVSTMARSGRDNRKLLCVMAVGLTRAFFIPCLLLRART